jgi:N utilization substance protein B
VPEYAVELVEGVVAHQERIDELLSTYAPRSGRSSACPPVDRAALRIGAYELLWCDDVPDGVAVSEAVELARACRPTTRRLRERLLGRLLQLKPSLAV